MIAKLVDAVGLAGEIDSAVTPLKLHTALSGQQAVAKSDAPDLVLRR